MGKEGLLVKYLNDSQVVLCSAGVYIGNWCACIILNRCLDEFLR